jgi:hypothetical protein
LRWLRKVSVGGQPLDVAVMTAVPTVHEAAVASGRYSRMSAWLTVQNLADLFERIEAHSLDLARFQQADEVFGDANLGRKVARAHFAVGDATSLPVYEIAPRERVTRKSDVKIDKGVGCRKAGVPEEPITIDVYLHADDEIGWLPLLEGFDLRPQIRNDEDRRTFDESVPP